MTPGKVQKLATKQTSKVIKEPSSKRDTDHAIELVSNPNNRTKFLKPDLH